MGSLIEKIKEEAGYILASYIAAPIALLFNSEIIVDRALSLKDKIDSLGSSVVSIVSLYLSYLGLENLISGNLNSPYFYIGAPTLVVNVITTIGILYNLHKEENKDPHEKF